MIHKTMYIHTIEIRPPSVRSMTGQDSVTTDYSTGQAVSFFPQLAALPAHIVLSGARHVTDVAWWRFEQKRGLLTDRTMVMGSMFPWRLFTSVGSVELLDRHKMMGNPRPYLREAEQLSD